MADYTKNTYVDDDGTSTVGTLFTKARMDVMEAGIKDAAQDSKQSLTFANLPAAAAANKNWMIRDPDTGQLWYSDGSTWLAIGIGNADNPVALGSRVNNGAAFNSGTLWTATNFVAAATGTAVEVEVPMRGPDAAGTTIRVQIAADTAGAPGSILATADYTYPGLHLTNVAGSYTTCIFRLPSLALTNGTTYWVVVTKIGTSVQAGIMQFKGAVGTLATSSDGSTWATSANAGFNLTVNGSTTVQGVAAKGAPAVVGTGTGETGVKGIAVGAAEGGRFEADDGIGVRAVSQYGIGYYMRRSAAAASAPADFLSFVDHNAGVLRKVLNDGTMIEPPTVTSLPTTGLVDGYVVDYLADATNNIIWRLRYRGSTFKWICVGGQPMWAEIATSETTASTTYANLATTGPSVTAPLAGLYYIDFGCNIETNAANQAGIMSPAIGAAAASDTDDIHGLMGTGISDSNGMRRLRKTLAASDAIVAKYKVSGAATGVFVNRWVSIMPINI